FFDFVQGERFRVADTGTTKPLGADTAIEISTKSLYTISFSSMRALTAGHSLSAVQTALAKNDMNPSPTPCFSLKASLYLARKSMIGFMFTSLNVVSMAVSFLTATSLRDTVLRREDIFSRRSLRDPGAAAGGAGVSVFVAGFWACAFSASAFVMRPSLPVPSMAAGSMPFSRSILAAAGEAVPVA